ncbi:glycosyltransferase family 4 protein [Streptomyces xinghaiensis]|uniref:glycosyltransferase family 4 protein n=1 Tax=Streptomyces xinghaiensis TaxID=1038928 RepID=UPI002E1263F3|nr:glycosyltransferase family 4 protein [Streptomyces xinghaiensis]
MKIAFLLHNAFGIGGTIRSTVNLSRALAVRHQVEVVSVHRVADEPRLPFDAEVRLTSLIDMREDGPGYEGGHALAQRPNTMFPDAGVDFGRLHYTALHDQRIAGYLARTDADVVIATRPILNGYLARHGQDRYRRIGQEHLSLDAHSDQLREDQNTAVRGLDAFVTVSEADARQYERALSGAGTTVLCIPNGVPRPQVEPAGLDSRTIVAAGRLVAVKRYDRLVGAFAAVADEYPGWTLRIYGRGAERPKLRRLIDELGLYNRVFLMGAVSPIETEWAKGAIAAVSSDMESFGMTIVEAMHCGVPVVATDCPHGPAEIITHGTDGLLVPLAADGATDGAAPDRTPDTAGLPADVQHYAAALRLLMSDDRLRRRLGDAAVEKASTFAPPAIARRYEDLFRMLSAQRYEKKARAAAAERAGLLDRVRGALSRGSRPVTPPARVTRRTRVTPAAPAAGTVLPDEGARQGAGARPVAFARSTSEGGIRVRLDAVSLPPGRLDFVARLRRDPERREIRVPLPEVATALDLSDIGVTLKPGEHALAEGRWDCYVAPRGGGSGDAGEGSGSGGKAAGSGAGTRTRPRIRLTAGLTEQARLIGRPPVLDAHGVSAWIPYTTTDGFLALRVWRRPAHAEVTALHIGEAAATVTATVLAPDTLPLTGTTVHAASREGDDSDFTVPLTPTGGPGADAGTFRFDLPYGEALRLRRAEHDVWDLTLRVPGDGPPVPIGRITGDLADRKKTDVYPPLFLDHPDRGTTRVRPFFTVDNALALSARDSAGTDT